MRKTETTFSVIQACGLNDNGSHRHIYLSVRPPGMEMFGRILMIYLSAIPAASTMPAMCWDDSALSLRDDKQVPSPINCSAVVMMSLDNHNGTVTEILL